MTCQFRPLRAWCNACDAKNALHYTLAEWQTRYGHVATSAVGGAVVLSGLDTAIDGDARADLYDLADYDVASVSGGSIWLRPLEVANG